MAVGALASSYGGSPSLEGGAPPGKKAILSGGVLQYVPVKPTTPLAQQYSLYNSAVRQQAGDYDNIMQGYKDLSARLTQNPTQQLSAQPYTPQTYQYQPTADYTSSLGNMRELADTGGYSQQGINDLRARGISPIRSIYASAQRNLDRTKALQGGYSPNYTAATAKLTRDLAQQIADQTTNVNAGIAQNVASNRLQAAPALTAATAGENALRAQYGRANVDSANEASRYNQQNALDVAKFNTGMSSNLNDELLRSLAGQQSLYGTTPALSSLFGTQALQGAQLQSNVNQQNANRNMEAIGRAIANGWSY